MNSLILKVTLLSIVLSFSMNINPTFAYDAVVFCDQTDLNAVEGEVWCGSEVLLTEAEYNQLNPPSGTCLRVVMHDEVDYTHGWNDGSGQIYHAIQQHDSADASTNVDFDSHGYYFPDTGIIYYTRWTQGGLIHHNDADDLDITGSINYVSSCTATPYELDATANNNIERTYH